MSISQSVYSLPETVNRPPCPKCAGKMMLVMIAPFAPGVDQRTFECKACDYTDKLIVKFSC